MTRSDLLTELMAYRRISVPELNRRFGAQWDKPMKELCELGLAKEHATSTETLHYEIACD